MYFGHVAEVHQDRFLIQFFFTAKTTRQRDWFEKAPANNSL
jgi:hypothetical protein